MSKVTLLLGLWIGWLGHHSTFAIAPCSDLVQPNDFFGKNERSNLQIGIKTWAKATKKNIQNHWAMGGEIAIGPVVAWHPLHGIGLETGLYYSYNYFFTVDFSVDRKKMSDASLFSFGRRVIDKIRELSTKEEGYIAHAGLGLIQFHAISLPLFFRLYPEKSRQLVCYGGPRFVLIFPGLESKEYCPIHIDTAVIKTIFYDALKKGKHISRERELTDQDIPSIAQDGVSKIRHSIFEAKPHSAQSPPLGNKLYTWDLTWDFGIEFRANAGFVIGINGLGFLLGYNFVK